MDRPIARRRALILALVIGCAVLCLTGAIRWGQWYSAQPYYRAQTHALLSGELALSHAPESVALDLAWDDGGVQQVWGLGVPLYLAPWELIGRAVGLSPFPDRLAMLFGACLMLYALARAWLDEPGSARRGSAGGGQRGVVDDDARSWAGWGALLITALLPGVVTMLRGQVGVYEEASAYAYGTAMLLLAGMLTMLRRPSTARYVLLMALAGASGLVRPTVWFYGAATALLATVRYVQWRGRGGLGAVALASVLFVAGGGALYASNAARFGRGGEFGHSLNLEDLPGNLYATRFDYPFHRAPLGDAVPDVLGGMFGRPENAAHRERYDRGQHIGQSAIPRWREFYFTTYTWAYLPVILVGLGCAVLAYTRRRRADATTPWRDTRWLAAWASLGGAPLLVFYLHSPSVSSRYYLDVGPAIAVLLAIAWRHAVAAVRRRYAGWAFAALVVVWASLIFGARLRRASLPPVQRVAAAASLRRVVAPAPMTAALTDAYDIADPGLATHIDDALAGPPPRKLLAELDDRGAAPIAPQRLYGNGTHWDVRTGAVAIATHVYVRDPALLDVEIAPLHGPVAAGFAPQVRAKIGLEELPIIGVALTARGVRVRFAPPRDARYRRGLQVAFLAFGPVEHIDRATSDYRLLRVAWREAAP